VPLGSPKRKGCQQALRTGLVGPWRFLLAASPVGERPPLDAS